jgi:hypothetical protein
MEVNHVMGSGDYASFDAYDDGGKTGLYVYRNGMGQSQATHLSYYASSCSSTDTAFTCTGSSAWGQIPNQSFQTSGQMGSADLTVDASSLYGSTFSYSCDYITWSCSFEEAPLPSGTIDVHWDRNTLYSYKTDSRQESDFVNMQFVSRNRATYGSASVEANVLGLSYSSAYGQVGTSQSFDQQILKY